MDVLKSHGKVFGAKLTNAERTAMNIEIGKQIAEYNAKNLTEIDALVLYTLHCECGFGKERLLRFYNAFNKLFREHVERYSFNGEDVVWLYTDKLKTLGIDLEKLNKEDTNDG